MVRQWWKVAPPTGIGRRSPVRATRSVAAVSRCTGRNPARATAVPAAAGGAAAAAIPPLVSPDALVAVAGGAGDNAASACGMGTVKPGHAFVSLGTSGVVTAVSDARHGGWLGALDPEADARLAASAALHGVLQPRLMLSARVLCEMAMTRRARTVPRRHHAITRIAAGSVAVTVFVMRPRRKRADAASQCRGRRPSSNSRYVRSAAR